MRSHLLRRTGGHTRETKLAPWAGAGARSSGNATARAGLSILLCASVLGFGCDNSSTHQGPPDPQKQQQFFAELASRVAEAQRKNEQTQANPLKNQTMEYVTTETGDEPWVFQIAKVDPEEFGYVESQDALDRLEGAITGQTRQVYRLTKRFSVRLTYRGKEIYVQPEKWGEPQYQQVKAFFSGVNVGEWTRYRGTVNVDPGTGYWYLVNSAGFQKAQ